MRKIIPILLFVILLTNCTNKENDKFISLERVRVYDTISVANFISIENLKSNYFFIGIDNPIRINSHGLTDSLLISIPENIGNVRWTGENTYIVRVKKIGRVTIEIARKRKGKKEILTAKYFRAKQLPYPMVEFGGRYDGLISKRWLIAQSGIKACLLNMDISLCYKVVGFTVSTVNEKGKVIENNSNSGKFTAQQIAQLRQLKKKQKFYIENVLAQGPDSVIRKLNVLMFKIK